ncbi:MAG: signal recognition particle-docking protein FtsY [Bdellovibrionales bacterium]|nr:signal recognition particle-docking protein FtsY [Bdellovibrionales bacterium]
MDILLNNLEITLSAAGILAGFGLFLLVRKKTIKKDFTSETPSEVQVSETKAQVPSSSMDTALKNTKFQIFGRLQDLFSAGSNVDWEDIEEILYTSDLGPKTVNELMEHLQDGLKSDEKKDHDLVKQRIKEKMASILSAVNGEANEHSRLLGLDMEAGFDAPIVWMIVGVNGSGKTTTIGKLANLLSASGKKVLLAAGDTFRAAADEQLKVWSKRAGVEIYSPEGIKDPSAVAFEAAQKAKAQGFDYLLVDTAGRLHTQKNLMEELKKMKRVVAKALPTAPHETILILDANNGQNALLQAKEFHQALDLSGIIFTKMDGSAKAGVAFGISNEVQVPIKRIGIGEKVEDLKPFQSEDFISSIFS